jgi:hypothetical protein
MVTVLNVSRSINMRRENVVFIAIHVCCFTELPINSPGDRDAISLLQHTSDGSSSNCPVAITLRTVQRLERDAYTVDGRPDFGDCIGLHSAFESHEMDCFYSPFSGQDLSYCIDFPPVSFEAEP